MQKKYSLFAGVFLIAMSVSLIQPASAQYNVLDKGTLYDLLEDPANKQILATTPEAFGSGTPYFAADGVIGASLLAGGIFGGVATMLFVQGRKGRYAAMGRG